MEALLVAIHELRPDWSAEFIKWIMDLVELNLTSSIGKFGNLWYRNKVGVVTGGSLSVALANIAVFYALRCALGDGNTTHLLGYKRFILDYIHGNSLIFGNNRNRHLGEENVCSFCNETQDGRVHQLSECKEVQDETHQAYIISIKDHQNYIVEILSSDGKDKQVALSTESSF